MSGKLVLQIYEGDVPLTQIGVAKIIMGMKDEHLREIANTGFRGEPRIPRYCNNKDHHHYNACIGGGICLAKKYKRIFSVVDLECVSCESHNITDTLNYMFEEYYDGRYRAEWRKPRRGKRASVEREKVSRKRGKKKEEEPAPVPDEIKQESITKKDSPKKKVERPPRKKKELEIVAVETGRAQVLVPNVSNVPQSIQVDRGKPRVKQGRPRNRKAEAA
jgi:hypothetical protein